MSGLARLIVVLTLLGACTNTSDDFSQIQRILTPGQVGFNPRFAALVEAGDAVPALQVSLVAQNRASAVLLESSRGGVETWLTPDGATLIMRKGMLVGTRGFGAGLMASDIEHSLAMVLGGQEGLVDRFLTFLDGDDEISTRTFRCQIENRGSREILVGAKPTRTRLMAEECRSLDQSFLNLYWISAADNRIIQARQWSGDLTGIITTRVVPR